MRLALLLLTLLAAVPAVAQQRAPNRAEDSRRAELDSLFEGLKAAPDDAVATMMEGRIRTLWAEQASPAALLLLRRGARNLAARTHDEALEDFDAAIVLSPQAAEPWHQRAQAYAALGDPAAAARDLQEALRIEPRHFGALLTLSMLQEERGDPRAALRSMEAALALHPRLRGGQQRLRELRRKVEGDAT
ncbi:tetratricopeptide repeat protein [Roseomonas sp. PWR1]|uniref:Tetratricopeptide repeat protein n=1 Tax=Roseomonas nitratireducens TaxID=2820810 RepID=A0ABS4ATB5_9PROT|nr:tetratricopeptide repeat protein [Neoroseomonas nitratireducens]MBP0464604.1 tetratricopeptide repeat protein [Neoroseomonas nitratireducens]